MKKTILLLSLLAAAAWAGPLAGKRVASFTLPDGTGKYFDVLDFRGKVLVIDIMKTDCPHCVATAKVLERAKARYGDKINVIAVVNPPDTPQKVADYVARNKVSYPILFDFGQATGAMLQITPKNPSISLPTVLIIDANGIIREDAFYSEATKSYFEGDGLFNAIGKAVAPAAPKK